MPKKLPGPEAGIPELKIEVSAWPGLLDSPYRAVLEKILLPYIRDRRWFGGKARKVLRMRIRDVIPLGEGPIALALIEVSYPQGASQTYLLPLAWKEERAAAGILRNTPDAAIARLEIAGNRGILYDAAYDKAFHSAFLSVFFRKRRQRNGPLTLLVERNKALLNDAMVGKALGQESRVLKGEQSNTSIIYGDVLFCKLFRRLERGVNPDVEIGARLAEKALFQGMPPFLGAVSLYRGSRFCGVLGLLQKYSPSRGDCWSYAFDQVSLYYERVLSSLPKAGPVMRPPDISGYDLRNIPRALNGLIGGRYLKMMSLLGRRTAEMHLALNSAGMDSAFRPEPSTSLYQRSVYRSMLRLTASTLRLLSGKLKDLPGAVQPMASVVLKNTPAIINNFRRLTEGKMSGKKIRIHGDFHLGQVLFTGKDFVIIDFEGEPAKPLAERRLKCSALRDVAGMLRSFHYAAWAPFYIRKSATAKNTRLLEPWAESWCSCVSAAFLQSYVKTAAGADFLPKDPRETDALLKVFLTEKAVYELSYELNNRPDWVAIPLKVLFQFILGKPGPSGN